MNRFYILILVFMVSATGCKNNNIEINGKLLESIPGKFIYLDELKSTELITVDSALVSEEGQFVFTREIEHPAFYLLKTDEKNFLTMLLNLARK